MKVLFDGVATQSSYKNKFHGGGEYAKYILKEAIHKEKEFDIVFFKNLYTDPDILNLLDSSKNINIIWVDYESDVYEVLDKGDYKRFYSALPMRYSNYPCNIKMLGVIHGLRSIELPWDDYRYKFERKIHIKILSFIISKIAIIQKYLKNKRLKKTQCFLKNKNIEFITVSNHTKYALLNFYPFLKPEQIKVYYSPFSIKENSSTIENKENYYLMVSGNRFEKNTYRCVKALDKLFSDGRLNDKNVIITGCTNEPFWNEIQNKTRFILKEYVSTEELQQLYEKAFCFIYPSLNEGFGYPPLQAMACNTPVIASSATSIPEVCDDAACYFSPTDIDDLCNRVLRVNNDEDYREMLIDRGLRRVYYMQEKQNLEIDEELNLIFD